MLGQKKEENALVSRARMDTGEVKAVVESSDPLGNIYLQSLPTFDEELTEHIPRPKRRKGKKGEKKLTEHMVQRYQQAIRSTSTHKLITRTISRKGEKETARKQEETRGPASCARVPWEEAQETAAPKTLEKKGGGRRCSRSVVSVSGRRGCRSLLPMRSLHADDGSP